VGVAEKLGKDLRAKRDKIRNTFLFSNDQAARVIAIRLGTGCCKTHLFLEAPRLLDAHGIYITFILEQHENLNRDVSLTQGRRSCCKFFFAFAVCQM
jgi:hypothetical protein